MSADNAQTELVVGCSTDKQDLLVELAGRFNEAEYESAAGRRMAVRVVPLDPGVPAIQLPAEIAAVAPEASFWLDDFEGGPGAAGRPEGGASLAASPVVLALWASAAAELGHPRRPIGWPDIVRRAHDDRSFRWGHAAAQTPGGVLALVALWGATGEEVDTESAAESERVRDAQSTVVYATSEDDLFRRLREDGPEFLAAFVLQEHLCTQLIRNTGRQLVIVPTGRQTVWADHPIAFLASERFGPEFREVYDRFLTHVFGADSQRLIADRGFRSTDPGYQECLAQLRQRTADALPHRYAALSSASPPIRITSAVAGLVRMSFRRVKRRANIFLVVDTSGSMRGQPLEEAQRALHLFVQLTAADQERVGLIEFNSMVNVRQQLASLGQIRHQLNIVVASLLSHGSTALYTAVASAYRQLQHIGDHDRINGVIVLTDGHSEGDEMPLGDLVTLLVNGNRGPNPVMVYCIAYGDGADRRCLEAITGATRGKVFDGNTTNIGDVYAELSRLF